MKEQCPASGKKCLKSNKANHFASQCRSKLGPEKGKIHGVGELFESEDEETENILTVKGKSVMSITENKFQLDSGATVNVLQLQLYRDIFNNPKLMHLEKTLVILLHII
jgi:hypothetical protein